MFSCTGKDVCVRCICTGIDCAGNVICIWVGLKVWKEGPEIYDPDLTEMHCAFEH